MNAKIKAISQVLCGIDVMCEKCGIKPHCEITHEKATFIYTAHVKPLEDALTKAEEREKVMVEALEECVPVLEAADEFFSGVSEALTKACAALASVKEEIPS